MFLCSCFAADDTPDPKSPKSRLSTPVLHLTTEEVKNSIEAQNYHVRKSTYGAYKKGKLSVSSNPRSMRKTFRPPFDHHKKIQRKLHEYARNSLGSGDVRAASKLPKGEDKNEWIATHAVDFFNVISLLYGEVSSSCTDASCPTMTAGPNYEYLWADGKKVHEPIRVSAPEYVTLLMCWVENQLRDESLFPTESGVPFPDKFMKIVKTIHRRLFRIYGHIYHSHFSEISALQMEAHLNSSFKHFIFFSHEFALLTEQEQAPLLDLIDKLKAKEEKKT